MALETLHDLLIMELKDLYNAEKQLVRALPRMAKNATSEALQEAFEDHLEETRGQVERIEQVCELLEARPSGKKCRGMEGLIEEGKEIFDEEADDMVRDAALILAAQKIEHYEIAAYATAITWAELLGEEEVASLLRETLAEEEGADEKLNEIAEGEVNEAAAESGEEEEGDEDDEEDEE